MFMKENRRTIMLAKFRIACGDSGHHINEGARWSSGINVISKFLKRYSKAKRTRAPAYSRALRRVKGGFQRGDQEKLRSDFQSTKIGFQSVNGSRGPRFASRILPTVQRSWTSR